MKAERRHQLQNNTLAHGLETFPEMLKRNASKIMLAITAVLLVAFIVRYRMNAAQAKQAALGDAMSIVRQGPVAIRQYDGQAILQASPVALAQYRAQIANDVNNAIGTVLQDADGDSGAPLRAEALVARGNLNWSLANLGALPGAATQPALQLPRSPADYLKQAEDAYRDVISAYSSEILSWASAQMGLAAVAENRHDWAAAREAYGAVVANTAVPPSLRQTAAIRINSVLPQIQQPIFLGSYPPATQSSSTGPSTMPTTAPATSATDGDSGSFKTPSATTQPSK